MYNSHRDNKSGGFKGGKRFGGGQSWDRGTDSRGFAKPELHNATCADCGNACQVPFKPNGRKPIYCSNCFKKDGNGGETRGFDQRPDARGFNSGDKPLFKTTCDKCGDACEVPFRPTGERPVYCRPCFGKNDAPERGDRFERKSAPETRTVDYSVDEFKKLNAKLDAILNALNHAAPAKAAKEEIVAKKEVVVKEETPKAPAKKKAAAKKKK